MVIFVLTLGLLLAFANGANDNFKGFATVWGSRLLSYGAALTWASVATAAGSAVSVVLATGLTAQFSGRGLVADAVVGDPNFIGAVAAGAAATVLLATRAALPISTTHAILGGLVGAGLAAGAVNLAALAALFVAPLLFSPIASATLAYLAQATIGSRLAERDCLCIVEEESPAVSTMTAIRSQARTGEVVFARSDACEALAAAHVRLPTSPVLERVHIASAITVCFARSVNDTPKLAALLLVAQGLGGAGPAALTAIAMVAGGVLFSRRVAETMSLRLNRLDPPQGLMANLVTSALVLAASAFALPVSTTHVAVGAITGAGARAHTLDWRAVRQVLLSWVATLPVAALCAWAVFRGLVG